MTLAWIRLILGSIFLLIGLVIFVLEVIGVFRLDYVMNRMHSAAMGDTLGIGSCVLGLVIFSGFRFATLKLLILIVFFWLSSPVSSHMLGRLETTVNDRIERHAKEYGLKELSESGEEEAK